MRHIMGLTIVGLAVLVLVVCVAMSRPFAAAIKVEVQSEQTFSSRDVAKLTASVGAGKIIVTEGIAGEIKLIATVTARAHTQERAQELAEAVEILADQNGQSLTFTPEIPRKKMRESISITMEIFVPWSVQQLADAAGAETKQLILNAGSGDISVAGLGVEITSRAGSGDTKATKITGAVQAISGSGDIEVSAISGAVNLRAGSGEIEATKVTGEVQANTGSGDIEVSDISGAVNLRAGSGEIEATTITGEVQANTGSGDIEVSDISGAVTLGAGSGDIEADRIGGSLEAKTGSGDIDVRHVGGSAVARAGSGDIEIDSVADSVTARTASGNIDVSNCSGDVTANSDSGKVTK